MIDSQLQRLAHRACGDSSFLGWQLTAFARVRNFDDDALAAFLSCEPAALANVRLCGAIRVEHFREDVTSVATKFSLNAARLAEAAKPLPAEPAHCERRDPEGADAVLAARDRGQT